MRELNPERHWGAIRSATRDYTRLGRLLQKSPHHSFDQAWRNALLGATFREQAERQTAHGHSPADYRGSELVCAKFRVVRWVADWLEHGPSADEWQDTGRREIAEWCEHVGRERLAKALPLESLAYTYEELALGAADSR